MPASALNNLGLNFDWTLGEDGWKLGMDLNLLLADWLAQPYVTVDFKTVSVQPADPASGTAYVLGAAPSGVDWATLSASENDLMIFNTRFKTVSQAGVIEDGWVRVSPLDGWRVFDRVNNQWHEYNETADVWVPDAGFVDVGAADETLDFIHRNQVLSFNTSAAARTLTVDDEAAIALPVGFRFSAYPTSASNSLTVDFTTNSVDVNGASADVVLSTAYDVATFLKVGPDAFVRVV